MCWHLVHNTLFDGAIVETEYVSGEVADHRWICHHFDFDCFRVFGFLDDYKVETSRPQNMLRMLEVYPGIQRATPSAFSEQHPLTGPRCTCIAIENIQGAMKHTESLKGLWIHTELLALKTYRVPCTFWTVIYTGTHTLQQEASKPLRLQWCSILLQSGCVPQSTRCITVL